MSNFDVLKNVVNEVWEALYPGSLPIDDLRALEMRIRNIAEDRNGWLFNAKVLQKQVNEMETRL